jgi:hypothetical protein
MAVSNKNIAMGLARVHETKIGWPTDRLSQGSFDFGSVEPHVEKD